jgi:hypothetical protein
MNQLYYYNPITVVNQLTTPDIKAWSSIYNFIGKSVNIIDRTETLVQPINTVLHSSSVMPTVVPTMLTFADCVTLRAKTIWDHAVSTNRKIGILYSGGIDSTTVLSSFIKNYSMAELKDRLYVLTSTEGIRENPKFYKDFILPNFNTISSEYLPWQFEKDDILVTGELNDQLFGSDLMKVYLRVNQAEVANAKLDRGHIIAYFNSSIDNMPVTLIMVNAIFESAEKVGVPLETNLDFFWWYNFCFKWQAVNFRVYALVMPRLTSTITEQWHNDHMFHFFQSQEFQLWSMNNPQVRRITDWKNYKQQAKEYIFELDSNKDYLQNKIKKPSLFTVFHHRKMNQGVDSNFNLINTINALDYYNPANDFVSN